MIDHQDLATMRALVHAVRVASKRRDGRATIKAPQTRLRSAVVAAACACVENIGRKIPEAAPDQRDGYLLGLFVRLLDDIRDCAGTVEKDSFVTETLNSIEHYLMDHYALPFLPRPKVRDFPTQTRTWDEEFEADP